MGYVSHARREKWQLFATLTFCSPVPPEGVRVKMLFAWLRIVSKKTGTYFPKLLWIARAEQGELNGRHHYHALISGLAPCGSMRSLCFQANEAWESIGGGMARVYEYSPELSAVDYLNKGLEESDYSRNAAQAYEFNKFSKVDEGLGLIPGHALLRKWGMTRERNGGLRKAHEMKAHQCDRSTRRTQTPMGKPARFPHPADLAGRIYLR